MEYRTLDIRLSSAGKSDLVALQRYLGFGRPGELMTRLLDDGHRPNLTFALRSGYGERMRATIPARMADEISMVARADGISIEAWVEALLRTACQVLVKDPACSANSKQPSDQTRPDVLSLSPSSLSFPPLLTSSLARKRPTK